MTLKLENWTEFHEDDTGFDSRMGTAERVPIKCSQCGASMDEEGECIYCGSHFRVLGKAPSVERSFEGFAGASSDDIRDKYEKEIHMYNNTIVGTNTFLLPGNNEPEKLSIFQRIKEWLF